jgi:hypothetical protein
MRRDDVARFVELLIDEIWEKHNTSKLEQFYHRNLEGYYNDDPVDFAALEKKLQVYQKHMAGMKVEVFDMLIEDQTFALRASHKINRENKDLSIPIIFIGHLTDGKISRYYLKSEMPLEFNS